MNARHSHDSVEWYTPSPYVEAARKVLGRIDLDPASHWEANKTVKATTFFTEADNGLLQDWYGCVFLNPPGGLVGEFWEKFCHEKHVTAGIWIGFSVEQLQTLQKYSVTPFDIRFSLCFPSRRIAFVESATRRDLRYKKWLCELESERKPFKDACQPSHANYICYRGSNHERFRREFGQFGVCK